MTKRPPLIVIAVDGKMSSWQFPQFGIPYFQSRGFEVFVFDAGALMNGRQVTADAEQGVTFDGSLEALARRMEAAVHVVFFSLYDLRNHKLAGLADLLISFGLPWIYVKTGTIPLPIPVRNLSEHFAFAAFQLRRSLRRFGFLGTASLIAERVKSSSPDGGRRAYPPKYVLVDGLESEAGVMELNAIRIPAHSRDYENKVTRGIEPPSNPEDICVFIDTNEARHSDWFRQGVAESELPDDETYRLQLLDTFETIERATGLKVVVLPHPRFHYPPGRFGRFEVRPGDTMSAVAGAKLVLGHYSTALGVAVIFNKPIMLMTCAAFRRCMGGRIDRHIRGFAAQLGSPLVSMGALRDQDLANWHKVDSEKYTQYWAKWIEHPDAPPGSMWETALRLVANHEGIAEIFGC